jgi:ATP-dependent HslUV protease subunit HslV
MRIDGTTILCVRKDGKTVIGGDGQITIGDTVMKKTATIVRVIEGKNKILAGFAGSVADAFTLFESFEAKLKEHKWQLQRASVELAKDWRTDKFLRKLEALMIVADTEKSYVLSGGGEVIEPEDGIAAIGSGGSYALAAARAMVAFSDKDVHTIVNESLKIASDICIYTNDYITIEEL